MHAELLKKNCYLRTMGIHTEFKKYQLRTMRIHVELLKKIMMPTV